MKKTLILLTGISVFLGAGYAAFAYTPLGKKSLSTWLIKIWDKRAKAQSKKLDTNKLKTELKKLPYKDHELLARITLYNPFQKRKEGKLDKTRLKKIVQKINKSRLLERADLKQLNNLILPG